MFGLVRRVLFFGYDPGQKVHAGLAKFADLAIRVAEIDLLRDQAIVDNIRVVHAQTIRISEIIQQFDQAGQSILKTVRHQKLFMEHDRKDGRMERIRDDQIGGVDLLQPT